MTRAHAATGIVLIAIALGVAGRLGITEYGKVAAERDSLGAEKARLAQEITRLAGDIALLESKTGTLASMRDSVQKERDALQGERDAIRSERDSLRKAQAETVSHYDALVNQLSEEVNQGHLKIKQYKNMLTVDVADKIFFDSGSADIKQSGEVVLRKVGKALALYPDKIIRVVGHTDSLPLSRAVQEYFSTNWELSASRATTVVRFLQDECNITPERLVAVGRGPYQPVARNTTPAGRQKNRRIEIMLLDRSAVEGIAEQTGSP